MHLPRPVYSGRLLSVTLVSCFALLVLTLGWPLLSGRLYVGDDLGNFHIPIRYVYQAALQAHHSFLWAPQFFGGLYLHGEGQGGLSHPLHIFLYRALSLQWAFSVEFLLSYLLMFPGMYVFLRRLELPPPAALFGAIIFTFSGFNLLHFMHINAIAIVAHIPWLLAAIDLLFRTTDGRQVALAQLFIALATASQLLLGYPQYVWFSALAEVALVAFRLRSSTTGWRVGAFVWATAVGVLLGGVQLLPTIEALRNSVRSDPSLQFRLSGSLEPVNLMQLWSPYGLDGRVKGVNIHEFGLYNGSVCTVALGWLFLRRRALGRWRTLVAACGAFAGAMLLLALGSHGGIYPAMVRLPLLGLFRVPSRHIVLVHLALAVLAAVMMADVLGFAQRPKQRMPWACLWPLAIPVGLSALTLGGYIWISRGPVRYQSLIPFSSLRRTALGAGLIVAATLLLVAVARGYRMAPLWIAMLTVADLSAWGLSYVWSVPAQDLQEFLERIPAPPGNHTGERVHVAPGSPYWSCAYRADRERAGMAPGRCSTACCSPTYENALVMKGYRIAGGYFALTPRRELPREDATSQRLLGVRWIFKDGGWMDLDGALPRTRLVTEAAVTRDVARDMHKLDTRRTALVDRSVGDLTATAVGTAYIVTDSPGLIEVMIAASGRQLLILSETYDSGWRATEDGRQIPIYRAYGDLMACVVTSATQRVVFSFEPDSFRWGLEASIGGGILAIVSFLGCLLLERKAPVPASGGGQRP